MLISTLVTKCLSTRQLGSQLALIYIYIYIYIIYIYVAIVTLRNAITDTCVYVYDTAKNLMYIIKPTRSLASPNIEQINLDDNGI